MFEKVKSARGETGMLKTAQLQHEGNSLPLKCT